jgi:phage terminase large subunit-like protein
MLMVLATRLFDDLLQEHRIWHDGDETLALHLRNCHAVERGENGWRLRKGTKSSAREIDGAISIRGSAVQPASGAVACPPP